MIAEIIHWSFFILALIAGYYVIIKTFEFWQNDAALTKDSSFYQFLKLASPPLLSLSVMSYFFRSVFKRRREIRELEEQRRQIKTISGALKAYSTFHEKDEFTKELSQTILKLRDAALAGFAAKQEGVEAEDVLDSAGNRKLLEDVIKKAVKDAMK